jgi:signal transduction histidine kinase
MNTFLRSWITDSRKFRLAFGLMALFITLGVALIAGLLVLVQRINDAAMFDALAGDGNKTIMVLNDEANVPFLPHVDRLNTLNGNLSDPAVRRARLDSLSHLPGARGAVCLVDGKSLETVPEGAAWNWLADSLLVLRGRLGGVRDEIAGCMLARAKFRTFIRGSDTLYTVSDTYDTDGRRIVRTHHGKKYTPEEAVYMFAVVMDPAWIRRAVRDHMDSAAFRKDALLLWTTFPDREGLGIIAGSNFPGALAGGDTIWWYGARNVTKKNRFSYKGEWDWTSNNWFVFRTVYELGDEELKEAADNPLLRRIMLGAAPVWVTLIPFLIGGLLLLSGTVFLISLVQLRRQWLARQTALEHLSHAIKTPVARLRVSSEMLLENRLTSPEVEHDVIRSVNSECARLERAVQNAELAIREGKPALRREPLELADLLSELCNLWQPVCAQHKTVLERKFDTPAFGHFDRDLIAVLFDNLLDNALRHARLRHPDGGARIGLSLTAASGGARIEVCDNGSGIDPADARRIFRRFERGRDSALTGVSGLGLGLALARDIAEAHGGSITVENAPAGGACFVVLLPSA